MTVNAELTPPKPPKLGQVAFISSTKELIVYLGESYGWNIAYLNPGKGAIYENGLGDKWEFDGEEWKEVARER